MKKHILFFILLVTTLQFSCDFELTEEYYADVKKREIPPELEVVDLNLTVEDTIYLYEDKTVLFSFKSDEVDIKEIRIYWNNYIVETFDTDSGKFQIDHEIFSEGQHKLKIGVVTNSNTNSMADILGAEGYLFESKEWTIVIQKTFPPPTYKIEDGALKIEWEKLEGFKLKQYEIKVSGSNYIPEKKYTTQLNYFFDRTYIGQENYYKISAISTTGKIIEFGHLKISMQDSIPIPNIIYNENKIYVEIKNKTFYSAEINYKIFDISRNNNLYLTGKKNLSEISQINNLKFGENYYLSIYAYSNEITDSIYLGNASGIVGLKIPKFNKIYSTNSNNVLLYNDEEIFQFDTENIKITDSIELTDIIKNEAGSYSFVNLHSKNGNYLTSYELFSNKLIIFKDGDIKNYEVRDIADTLTNQTYYLPSDLGNIFLFASNNFHLLSINNMRITSSFLKLPNHVFKDLSSKNKYVLFHYYYTSAYQDTYFQIFKIEEDSLIYQTDIPIKYEGSYFNPKDDNELIFVSSNTVNFIDAQNGQLKKEIIIDCDKILNIDYKNQKILSCKGNKLVVFDITTGEYITELQTNFYTEYDLTQTFLFNNIIFNYKGIFSKIDTIPPNETI